MLTPHKRFLSTSYLPKIDTPTNSILKSPKNSDLSGLSPIKSKSSTTPQHKLFTPSSNFSLRASFFLDALPTENSTPQSKLDYPDFKSPKAKRIRLKSPTSLILPTTEPDTNSRVSFKVSRTRNFDEEQAHQAKTIDSDNHLRRNHIKTLLTDFNHRVNRKKSENENGENNTTRTIQSTEKIFTLYGLTSINILAMRQDSNMIIEAVPDSKTIARCLEALVPEICKFPYSFFKKIGIKVFQFCGSIEIIRVTNIANLRRKLYNGLLTVTSPQECIRHFYKHIIYGMKTINENFDEEWLKVTKIQSNDLVPVLIQGRWMTKPRDLYEEQAKAMIEFMENPVDFMFSMEKCKPKQADLFRRTLEMCDNIGINGLWWESIGVEVHVKATSFPYIN